MASLVALALPLAGYAQAGASGSGGDNGTYRTKVLVKGAPLNGANGLAFDTEGTLVVAEALGGEVVLMNPRSGRILDRFGHADQVDGPDDVAVGEDGSIYWTDLLPGEVGRRAPDGTVTKQFVAPGMNPISISEDGRLFVGSAFIADGLYELDLELKDPPRTVIPPSTVPPFLDALNGFDFGPDGMLYAPQPFRSKLVRIDPDTGEMSTVVPSLGGNPATSVEFDSQGRLYASRRFDEVIRVDTSTGDYETFARFPGLVADNMAFDARDTLYVSDSVTGAIRAAKQSGGKRLVSRGGMMLPGGIAIREPEKGRSVLFVGDVWSLDQYDARTGRLLDTDVEAVAPGGIADPITAALDGDTIIVSSWFANAVQVWDPVAKKEVEIHHDFATPLNALRFRGALVVAQLGNPQAGVPAAVVSKDAEGTKTQLATGLVVPSGLAATGDDLWVADWATGELWQVVDDGDVLSPIKLVTRGLTLPEGMAVDVDGSLLVVESGAGRLTRVDPATGEAKTVADNLALGMPGSKAGPPTHTMSSVAVAQDGTLYVTGDIGNVIYRLTP